MSDSSDDDVTSTLDDRVATRYGRDFVDFVNAINAPYDVSSQVPGTQKTAPRQP